MQRKCFPASGKTSHDSPSKASNTAPFRTKNKVQIPPSWYGALTGRVRTEFFSISNDATAYIDATGKLPGDLDSREAVFSRASAASLFNRAASSVSLAFSESERSVTLCVPLNSIAKPTTSINQQIPEKISHECSCFLKLFLKNNLAIISAPSPATPIKTILKPHSATDSQNLSDAESREVMRGIYQRRERLNFWTAVALAALAIIWLIKIFIKRN
jgi:hypothetical protein